MQSLCPAHRTVPVLVPSILPLCTPEPHMRRALTTAYVDDHLIATGKICKAAIVGKQGGIWAQSAGYNVSIGCECECKCKCKCALWSLGAGAGPSRGAWAVVTVRRAWSWRRVNRSTLRHMTPATA